MDPVLQLVYVSDKTCEGEDADSVDKYQIGDFLWIRFPVILDPSTFLSSKCCKFFCLNFLWI